MSDQAQKKELASSHLSAQATDQNHKPAPLKKSRMTSPTMLEPTVVAPHDLYRTEFADPHTATATEGFNILSNLDLDDCDNLDPSLFANVTPEDLDSWLQESLDEMKGDENNTVKVAEAGRRLSLCLGAEIRRKSLMLGSQGNDDALRRCSNFSEFNFNANTLPQNEKISNPHPCHHGADTMSEHHYQSLALSDHSRGENMQKRDGSPLSTSTRVDKKRRLDQSFLVDDQPLQRLFAAVADSSSTFSLATAAANDAIRQNVDVNVLSSFLPRYETAAFCGSSTTQTMLPSSSITPSTQFSIEPSPSISTKKSKNSVASPVVPLISVVSSLATSMDQSEKSEQEIHDWDRNMGLRRSHSKTMRATGRSRKQLQQLQKQLWQGDMKQCLAKGA